MRKVRTCRSCGSGELLPFLSLGRLPIPEVLALDRLHLQEARLPLELAFCKRCTMVQLLGNSAFDPSRPVSARHRQGLSQRLLHDHQLLAGARVLCLQSVPPEDLARLRQAGVGVLYVESVPELVRQAQAKGIPTRSEIFDRSTAERLAGEGFQADVILAGEILGYAPDLNGLMEGLVGLLRESGILFLELPDLAGWLQERQFDRFNHRFQHYLSAHALDDLLRRHGLWLNGLETLSGGGLRAHASRRRTAGPSLTQHLAEEKRLGLTGAVYYQEFASAVASVREALLALLIELRARGHRIAAHGAGEASSLLLNFVGLGSEVVEFVVDDDPARQGRFIPGVRVPIYAPARLREERPEYLLVLGGEGKVLEGSEYVARGGKLILPLPYPEIINPAARAVGLRAGV